MMGKSRGRGASVWLALLYIFAFSLRPAYAQFTSVIEGVVTDSTGAVVPRAKISVVNTATQVKYEGVASDTAAFRVSALPRGVYRVEVQAGGFKTWVQTDLLLESNQVRTIYPLLEVGEVRTTVEVSAVAVAVETGRSQTAREVEQRVVEEAPMNARNVYASLAMLAPGITGAARHTGGTPTLGTDNYGTELQFEVYAAGQRLEANDYQLDGSSIVVQSRGGAVYISPDPDIVEAMKISTSDFSADKGRASGALIQVFTKSGTNDFHGTLSEFHSNNALTSRTVFQRSLPAFRRNEFGGTLGGPIVRNRTFFFGSLHVMRASRAQTSVTTVETPQFAQFVTNNFPNSIAPTFFREAPPAVVPTADIRTVGQLRALDPGFSDSSGFPDDLPAIGTAVVTQSLPRPGHQWNVRVDHNFQRGDRLYANFIRIFGDQIGANIRPSQQQGTKETGIYAKLSWIRSFSPTLFNEASFTYVRNTGDLPVQKPILPPVFLTRVAGFGAWGSGTWAHNDFNWKDVVSWMKGSHNIRFGTDIFRQRDDDPFTPAFKRPVFFFASLLDFAQDFPFFQSGPVINTVTGGAADVNARQRELYISGFIQDDWKVTPRLTVNLGLRYENLGHIASVKNDRDPIHKFTLGPGATFPEQVANGFMELRGGDEAWQTSKIAHGLGPRIGFGWDIFGDGTTAFRGGYGIYFSRLGGIAWREFVNPPTFVTPSITIFDQQPFTYTLGPDFQPPPNFTVQINERGGIAGLRVAAQGLEPDLDLPTTHSWMVSLQRALGRNILLEGYYNGSRSNHLYLNIPEVNRFPGDLIINDGKLTRLNAFFGPVRFGRSIGISDTHFGSVAVGRRYSRGWSLRGIFTFGKGTDFNSSSGTGPAGAGDIADHLNLRAQKGRSDFNVAKRFSIDSVIEIPVPWNTGAASKLLGGWQLTTIALLEGGQPFSVFTRAPWPTGDFNADGFNFDFPNQPAFGNSISAERSDFIRGLFKASDFPRPEPGKQGDLGRNTFTGPGLANVDVSFAKATPIPWFSPEGASLQIRAEIFNLINRVNLGRPVGDLSSGQFGRSVTQFQARTTQFGIRISF